jgi:hypothetical protein
MSSLAIIIARYKEKVGWALPWAPWVQIYNKGEWLPEWGERQVSLPNVGREGHTFYHYIAEHYEHLPDWIFFLQGYPFDHCPCLQTHLENALQGRFVEDKPGFAFLSQYMITCSLDGCAFHDGLDLRNVWNRLFPGKDEPGPFVFGAGGQMMVSRECIKKRPRSFYAKVAEMLSHEICPPEGNVIERFPGLIFSS